MRYSRIFLAATAMLVSLTFIAYAQDANKDPSVPVTAQSAPADRHGDVKEKRFVAVVGPDGVQHVSITGGGYFFDPNYVVVKANVPVELSVKKEKGYVPHDIMVRAPLAGIDFAVDLKETPQVVRFTPTKPGKYEMRCDKKLLFFKSHQERGMDGVIEVIP
jgi:heme/copper-type cytochrome/quinol oxidase subunit 2